MMEWNEFETAPKTREEILVCNIKQGGVLQLIRWNSIHKHWQSKGQFDSGQWTHWTPILNIPNGDASESFYR